MRANQLRVAFLTHGGATVGLGHIRRCLALARGLAERGADPTFLVSPGAGLGPVVKAARVDVAATAWEDSAPAAVNAVRVTGATTAVVDTYTATPPLFDALRAAVGRLVAIDDTADRPLPVDVVINGGLGAETLKYRASPDTMLLLGTKYALLEPEFASAPDRGSGGRSEEHTSELQSIRHLVCRLLI